MSAINQRYAHEMYEKFGYLATWLPNVKLKLGDVGVVRKCELVLMNEQQTRYSRLPGTRQG